MITKVEFESLIASQSEIPLDNRLPRVLPSDWVILQRFGDGYACQSRSGLRVICSTADFPDGRDWLHVSVSRVDRLPTYQELKIVKNIFIGADKFAYQVFASDSEHVNIHEFCLHLWCPLTGDLPLPDFTRGGNSI